MMTIYQIKILTDLPLPIKLIRVISDKATFKRRLLEGERSGPPEDCGGTSGYESLIHFFKTGEDEWDDDPEGLETWLDGWKPDSFVLEDAKRKFDK